MQKKNIFSIVVGSFMFGAVGGAGTSYLMIQDLLDSDGDSGASIIQTTYVEESLLIEAQQAVAPSVVSIIELVTLQELRNEYFGGGPFGGYFVEEYDPDGDGLAEIGGGTGFIIDPSGIVLTNKHVVSDDAQYIAILNDGTEFDVVIEALDPGNDIAILTLTADAGSVAEEMIGSLPYAELGDSDDIQVAQQVLAIGNALAEYENTTTAGIISAKGRKIIASDSYGDTETLYGLIQTDAAINPGNSGGPLINLNGEVIGINTAIDTEAEGIGFAIPINDVKPAVESWRLNGEILRPILGVRYVMLSPARARELGLDVTGGALIVGQGSDPEAGAVVEGSPADEAGLRAMDVVLQADGEDVDLDFTLQDAVLRHQLGDEMVLTIWRDGQTLEVTVELTQTSSSD